MSIKNIGVQKWKIVVRLKDKKRQATLHGTKEMAQLREIEMKQELRNEISDESKERGNNGAVVTFNDALLLYEYRSRWAPHIFSKLQEYLGHIKLKSEGPGIWEGLEEFVKFLGTQLTKHHKPYSPGYINRHITQAKAAISQAYRPLRKIDQNYLEGFPMLPEHSINYRTLSNEERERLYFELPDYLKPIFYYASRVPARVGELVNLTIDDIDMARKLIVLDDGTTKNGSGRWLPIVPEFVAYLESIPKDCPYVFYRIDEEGFQPLGYYSEERSKLIPSFKRAWYSACKRASISGYNFHKTRQSSAMSLLYDGYTDSEVKIIGGWKSQEAYERYVRVEDMMLMKRMGNWESDNSWMKKLAPSKELKMYSYHVLQSLNRTVEASD